MPYYCIYSGYLYRLYIFSQKTFLFYFIFINFIPLLQKFSKIRTPNTDFMHIKEISPIFNPTTVLYEPLDNLPNWIPAPIPIYTPPPIIPYTKMNDLIELCNERYNASTPEIPTVINTLTNAVVFKTGDILTANFLYLREFPQNKTDTRQMEVFDQAIPWFHEFSRCYFHFLIETFPLVVSFGPNITNQFYYMENFKKAIQLTLFDFRFTF